jgi:hypothetical protein
MRLHAELVFVGFRESHRHDTKKARGSSVEYEDASHPFPVCEAVVARKRG